MMKIGILMACVFFSGFASEDSVSGSPSSETLNPSESEYFRKKLDSLDVKLERILIEMSNNNPFSSGQYLNWGSGIYVAGVISFFQPNIDFGYMFKIRRIMRIGPSLGSGTSWMQRSTFPDSYLYMKFVLATPVFVNFLSISTFIQPIYLFDKEFCGGINDWYGIGLGIEMEFFISPKICLTFGNSMYRYKRKSITHESALVGPFTLYQRVQFGMKFFIKKSK